MRQDDKLSDSGGGEDREEVIEERYVEDVRGLQDRRKGGGKMILVENDQCIGVIVEIGLGIFMCVEWLVLVLVGIILILDLLELGVVSQELLYWFLDQERSLFGLELF